MYLLAMIFILALTIDHLSNIIQLCIQNKCAREMLPFRNTQSGSCFIIGTGPSHTIDNLELINEVSFSSYRIYNMFPRKTWKPTFYACQDDGEIFKLEEKFYDISSHVGIMFRSGNQKSLLGKIEQEFS